MSSNKKTAYALRDFKDAGTGENFEKGARLNIEEGVFRNYKAAGLVGTRAPEDVKSSDGGTGKTA